MADIQITYDGQPAITGHRAAIRYGYDPVTFRQVIKRLVDSGKLTPLPERLDDRTPLYLIAEFDTAMDGRRGRGNWRKAGSGPASTPDAT